MIIDLAMFNSLSNDNREWKSSANKSSAFAITLSCHLYTPGAWAHLWKGPEDENWHQKVQKCALEGANILDA